MRKFITVAGVLATLALVAAIPALAQEEEPETRLDDGPPLVGTITSISGDVIRLFLLQVGAGEPAANEEHP